MKAYLRIEQQGIVPTERIVTVGRVESAAMKRLLSITPPTHILILTGGKRRRSVIVLDSGHLVVTTLTVAEINWQLAEED
jgi:regulator of extracellular matrix RemA (YlzA/DUF370 family)